MREYPWDALPSFISDYGELQNDARSEEYCSNGLYLNGFYLPQEVILNILSHVDTKNILKCSLVCYKWNRLIKSYSYWKIQYERRCEGLKAKKLPWYVYFCLFTNDFDKNMLKNNTGGERFDHWKILQSGGDGFNIEIIPVRVLPPPCAPEFNGGCGCFVTSHSICCKRQYIDLWYNKLLGYVINWYKPHIYLSEWVAARTDCGSMYRLECGFVSSFYDIDFADPPCAVRYMEERFEKRWKKVELLVKDYPDQLIEIAFQHQGKDLISWGGYYGPKMGAGVFKFIFDSIEPLEIGEDGKKIPKEFVKSEYYVTNGLPKEEVAQINHLFYKREVS